MGQAKAVHLRWEDNSWHGSPRRRKTVVEYLKSLLLFERVCRFVCRKKTPCQFPRQNRLLGKMDIGGPSQPFFLYCLHSVVASPNARRGGAKGKADA